MNVTFVLSCVTKICFYVSECTNGNIGLIILVMKCESCKIMRLYCCGFNGFGQVSPSKQIDTTGYTLFPLKNVTDVSFSWNYMVVLTGTDVYVSGFVEDESNIRKKLILGDEERAIQAACSSSRALILTDSGECWQYISSTGALKKLPNFVNVETEMSTSDDEKETVSKQCRRGKRIQDGALPNSSSSESYKKIVKICCGEAIHVAVTAAGCAFSIPSPLPLTKHRVTAVACGIEHCLLLTDAGTVYSWGTGTRGQLGLGTFENEDKPCEVEVLSGLHVTFVAAGGWHSAAVTLSGDLYMWGWNNSGQLGRPAFRRRKSANGRLDDSSSTALERKLSEKGTARSPAEKGDVDDSGFSQIGCRKYDDTSGIHSDENKAKKRKAGADEEDAFKTDEKDNSFEKDPSTLVGVPMPVDFPSGIYANVKEVGCGSRHTIVLLDDGSVWGCGWNAYGQLGKRPSVLLNADEMTRLTLPSASSNGESGSLKVVGVRCGAWNSGLLVEDDLSAC